MAEPRKNHGRKRVSRRSQTPRAMTIQERLDLILRFDAGVLTTEKRHAIVEKIMAALSAQAQAQDVAKSENPSHDAYEAWLKRNGYPHTVARALAFEQGWRAHKKATAAPANQEGGG